MFIFSISSNDLDVDGIISTLFYFFELIFFLIFFLTGAILFDEKSAFFIFGQYLLLSDIKIAT